MSELLEYVILCLLYGEAWDREDWLDDPFCAYRRATCQRILDLAAAMPGQFIWCADVMIWD